MGGGREEEVFGDSLQKAGFAGGGISEGPQSTGQWSAIQRKTFLNVQISKHAPIPEKRGQINKRTVHPILGHLVMWKRFITLMIPRLFILIEMSLPKFTMPDRSGILDD